MNVHYYPLKGRVALKGTRPADAARPSTAVAATGQNSRTRLDSIDLLRGLVMVVMALDHTRDFFAASGMNPRDVADPALFLTRWITHFCAPIFIFLAGVSAYLYGTRGRTTAEISRFLFTRGFWLIVLEFTFVRMGWFFGVGLDFFVMQVIWSIGASMVALSALVWLPRAAIGAVGLGMIAGHNLLDGIHAADFGAAGWIWNLLHESAMLTIAPSSKLRVLYPLVPWVGVMAAGFALGPIFMRAPEQRRRLLFGLGAATTAGFVALRLSNLYGDPAPWIAQETALSTVLSVLNVEKYPPSLLYLMMTLGPGLMLLAAFEHARGRLANWITTFGRVPMLYYVAHIFLIHAAAVVMAWIAYGDASWLFGSLPGHKPAGYGLPLAGVYAVWLLVVVSLYPLCRWFAGVKRRRSDWWLSYL
jgi:uncharacterized membrane protein